MLGRAGMCGRFWLAGDIAVPLKQWAVKECMGITTGTNLRKLLEGLRCLHVGSTLPVGKAVLLLFKQLRVR